MCESKIYTIQKTRIGFGYQDKYALFIFLKYLLDKNIKAFFVDKPFKNNFSLDILIIPRKYDDIEIIYEVKTGKEFQKKSEEIAHALKVFFYYASEKRNKKKCEFHLIVIPELKEKLDRIWLELKHLQNNKFFSIGKQRLSPKELAKTLIREFRLEKEFSDYKKFKKFIQNIKEIKEGDAYEKISESSEFTKIEDQIIQLINSLYKIFKIRYPVEMKPEHLMKNLLYDIQKGAENGEDIYLLAKESMIDFFVHKSIMAKKTLSNRYPDPNSLMREEREEIERIFIEHLEKGATGRKPKIKKIYEGEEVK